jgi:outer membrane lipoprotein-sorting protein
MLIAMLVVALQDDAEATYKKFEKMYADAKSVSAKFTLEIRDPGQADPSASISGSIRVKPGEKILMSMTVTEKGSKHELEARCDGKLVVQLEDGKRSEKPARPGTGKFLVSALCRTGYGVMLLAGHEDEGKAPDPDTFAKPKDFKLSKDGDDLVLEYTLVTQDLGDLRAKLWLTSALVPKKRQFVVKQGDKEGTFTETYDGVSTDEIPDSAFEHQK